MKNMSNTLTLRDRIIAEIADATEAEIIAEINYEILNTNGDARLRNPEEKVLANMVHSMMPIEHDIHNHRGAFPFYNKLFWLIIRQRLQHNINNNIQT